MAGFNRTKGQVVAWAWMAMMGWALCGGAGKVEAQSSYGFLTERLTVIEGESLAVTIRRTGEQSEPGFVDLRSVNGAGAGAAFADQDFEGIAEDIPYEASVTGSSNSVAVFDVNTLDNDAVDGTRTFFLELSNPRDGDVGGGLEALRRVEVTIVDDDFEEPDEEPEAPPVITSPDKVLGSLKDGVFYTITAINDPEVFGAANLPPGLGVDAETGDIVGTPVRRGKFRAVVIAANASGVSAKEVLFRIKLKGTSEE